MFGKKKPSKEDAFDLLWRALTTGSSTDAILGQEADGQRSFVQSETLPTQMSPEARAALEAAGVVFGPVVEGDSLFQYVQLPEGWTMSVTSHSMHNDLLDEKGRKRASIFYKAVFYDRRANLYCERRFGVDFDYEKLVKGIAEAFVIDEGIEIFRTASVVFDVNADYQVRKTAEDKVISQAEAWLKERFPDWENPAAYWD